MKNILKALSLQMPMLKARVNSLIRDEKGAVDLITIIVLIAVVMILVVVFREQMMNLINSLFDSIGSNADKATQSTTPTPGGN